MHELMDVKVICSSLKWLCLNEAALKQRSLNGGEHSLDKEVIHSRIIGRMSRAAMELNSFLWASLCVVLF